MLGNKIKIGDRIKITLKKDEDNGVIYISHVENILDDENLIIQLPQTCGEIFKLPLNENYSFLFFTEKGMLKFEGSIINSFIIDDVKLMTVRLLSHGEIIQRREFFRLVCHLPFKFSLNQEYGRDILNPFKYNGIVKDLSGGGISFISDEFIEKHDNIQCLISFENNYIITIAKIYHKQKTENSYNEYLYRAFFTDISPKDQEKIVHHIFLEHRKKLQRPIHL